MEVIRRRSVSLCGLPHGQGDDSSGDLFAVHCKHGHDKWRVRADWPEGRCVCPCLLLSVPDFCARKAIPH